MCKKERSLPEILAFNQLGINETRLEVKQFFDSRVENLLQEEIVNQTS